MKIFLKSFLSVLFVAGEISAQNPESVPKLVVGITIDQLRYDYIEMFKPLFGEKGFAEGLLGFGAKIDSKGYGEMRRLKVWEELVVPLLVYNRVDVVIGDKWRSPGAGIIETVTPDTDEEGNTLSTGTATLKLEDGEIGAIAVDDMAMGIWHFGNGSDATEDSDDSKGNFTFAGFTTAYWRITEVTGDDNKTFRYALRPGYTTHPQPQMTFSCRGNFTNEDRQKSVYETRTYTRMLHHQNEWEITASNIAMQYGDLSNLNVFGMNMEGYSMYLNSVYFTGTITQMKPDGTPIRTANDRGAWPPSDNHADYFDRFSYDGCIWLCVNESGTTKAPGKNNPDWLLQVDKGADGEDGTSVKILGSFTSTSQLPASGNDPGDGYLIDGDLWVWDGSKFKNVGKIQGPAGESVKPLGNWYTGLHVQNLGVVRMWHSTYMCNVSDGTDNPPAWCWTDKDGNRFTFNDGGYALTGELNTAEYLTIATDGADAKSIINVDVEYAISTSNTTAPTSGWQTTAPTWENGKYIWSRTATYYSDDTVTYTDSACISGGKGIKKITEWYYRSSSATELIGGEWTTEYPGWVNGTYIWTKSIIEYTDGTAEVSNSLNATGSQGEGYTNRLQANRTQQNMTCYPARAILAIKVIRVIRVIPATRATKERMARMRYNTNTSSSVQLPTASRQLQVHRRQMGMFHQGGPVSHREYQQHILMSGEASVQRAVKESGAASLLRNCGLNGENRDCRGVLSVRPNGNQVQNTGMTAR